MKLTPILALAVGIVAVTLIAKPHGQRNGTDVLHLNVDARLQSVGQIITIVSNLTGVVTNIIDVSGANGTAKIKLNQQGNADNQRLDLRLGGLDANAGYLLLATLGDDTNFTIVAPITTTGDGTAKVSYKHVGSSQGQGNGHGHQQLPGALNPLYDVRELAVANSATQVVLFADLTAPNRFTYLVKRDLDNDGVDADAAASMSLQANGQRTQIRLQGSGLALTNTYSLALNGNTVASVPSDDRGRVNFKLAFTSPAALDIRSVQLFDSATNSVLSTTLP